MSHPSSAHQHPPNNARQLNAFAALTGPTVARRVSLANSAGLALGSGYACNLTRPCLSLNGGRPRAESAPIQSVVAILTQVVQRRTVCAGEAVGYKVLWRAPEDTLVAIVNMSYADGRPRALPNRATQSDRAAGGRRSCAACRWTCWHWTPARHRRWPIKTGCA